MRNYLRNKYMIISLLSLGALFTVLATNSCGTTDAVTPACTSCEGSTE